MTIAGLGTQLRKWDGAGNWVAQAEITNITGPSMNRTTIDSTTMDTTGGYMTFISALRDPGSLSLDVNFTRAVYDIYKDDFENDAAQSYEIVLPDADKTTFEFEGLVTDLPMTIPVNDKISMNITIKISGAITVNSGSGPSAEA